MRKCREADAAASIDHACRLVQRIGRTGTFKHILHALAAGDPPNCHHGVFMVHVDDSIGTEAFPHLEAAISGSGKDDWLCAESFCNAHTHQADRAGSDHHNSFAGDDAAQHIEAIHGSTRGNDQRRLFIRHVMWHVNHRVHVIHRIFRKPTIGTEPIGAMSLALKAIIQARGVHPFAAALTAAATSINLNGDTIAELKFVDGRTKLHHRAHVPRGPAYSPC